MIWLSSTISPSRLPLRLVKSTPRYVDTSVDNIFDGYRLPENWAAPRASPEIERVLVLGDSFTWGDGVHEEDAYPFRMQFRLNLRDGWKRYRVLNAGRNGLNTVDERELIEHCKTLIAGFKCPRSVEFRDEPLPLSGAGKVLKRELREAFAGLLSDKPWSLDVFREEGISRFTDEYRGFEAVEPGPTRDD